MVATNVKNQRRRTAAGFQRHHQATKAANIALALLLCFWDASSSTTTRTLVSAFGWIKRTPSLSERLMGMRPELSPDPSPSSLRRTRQSPQQQHQQQNPTRTGRRSTRLFANSNNSKKPTTGSTKQDQASMIDFINQPSSAQSRVPASDADPLGPLDVETMDMVHTVCRAADGRKAQDIVALKVHHISTLTSVLVVLSGNSRPQNQAIAAAIVQDVQELCPGNPLPGGNGIPEGSADSGWMVLDYGVVMVHIMTPKSRLFYNVQGQWEQKGAQPLPLDHILLPNFAVPPGANNNNNNNDGTTGGSVVEQDEDDPFWS
mmetsp:Transcript_28403/g.78005  ORF Transcript_28403/g.78005 Transcript_28403/m.78005 type:complete len:317 (+) Transcript_28403:235-1185(+)